MFNGFDYAYKKNLRASCSVVGALTSIPAESVRIGLGGQIG